MHQKKILKNGLRLITAPMKGIKSVTVLMSVRAGSRYETAKNNGISHFLEHMLFKGTKKRPTAFDISSTIDSVGGEFNASVDKESTSFYVKCGSKHLSLGLDLLADILVSSLLKPEEIEKERGVIIEEINMREDIPMAKVGEVFDSLLYENTPLGRRIIGQKENIKKMQRKTLLSYIKRFYRPEKMVVAIAGDQSATSPPRSAFAHLAGVGGSGGTEQGDRSVSISSLRKCPKLKLHYKKTEQAHFCLGVRAFKRTHPDRYALSVLATILGGNMSSRLFTEVREKRGLAYYIHTSSARFHETGHLVTQAGVDVGKIEEAIKVILEEYHKVQSSKFKVQSEELKKAKEYLKGRLILALEDSHAVAALYAESELLENKVRTPEEIIKGIEKVTVEDVVRLAQKIFLPNNLNLAIIGPYKNERRFEKIISGFLS